jgi:uncharacterized protein YbaP (TraB family)
MISPLRVTIAALLGSLAAPAAAAPALWTVRDTDTTVYLFGTVHALPSGVQWFDGPVRQAFERSDTLVLEMVAPKNEADVAPVLMSLGFADGQPPLADRVGAEQRARLTTAVRESGVPAATLNAMETWLATVTLSASQLTRLGLDPKQGVERQLTVKAQSLGKKVHGLESMAEQMGFFDGLPEADQRAYLTATLKQWPDMKARMGDLVGRWVAGDVEALGSELNESLRETPKLSKLLLADRNARWADWIRTRMAQPGTLFVAVGAGHLTGPDSVQAMLAKQGLKAERVAQP